MCRVWSTEAIYNIQFYVQCPFTYNTYFADLCEVYARSKMETLMSSTSLFLPALTSNSHISERVCSKAWRGAFVVCSVLSLSPSYMLQNIECLMMYVENKWSEVIRAGLVLPLPGLEQEPVHCSGHHTAQDGTCPVHLRGQSKPINVVRFEVSTAATAKNAIFRDIKLVRTSQETHYVSATEPNQLMLCKIWDF
jgi:hypothetical protein